MLKVFFFRLPTLKNKGEPFCGMKNIPVSCTVTKTYFCDANENLQIWNIGPFETLWRS